MTPVDVTPAVEVLDDAKSVTILCHVQPDADTIGSGLALAQVLRRRGVPVVVAFAEPAELPVSMRSLPATELIVPVERVPATVDVLVTVDCGSAGRLGVLRDRLAGAATTLVIDHHRSNTRFGGVNVIDEAAESTAGVIARVLDAWGEPIDRDIAHCLFAGLVTDTGSFKWTRPGSHTLAERLLATGIDGATITRTLMDTHPFAWLPMLSRVLASAQLLPDAANGAGLVYAVVRREDTEAVRSEEVESIIDLSRTTAEAQVAAVFKESRAESEHWTVSLRSHAGDDGTPGVDVARVATALGGGGHRYAAGYSTVGAAADMLANLLRELG
ncbi:DHH family phosphoesterase [Nocardia seriolae]|uniref:Bifunctional oligoribonuclease and PAP phosphatase NrnA n=1 Tax=Nocardia seriolae TaxID=37332 RepID=A0A0B8N3Z8_9NOCA|nr:bifunctional oligoribonuclease/PAP phosphatase NrnA [Nocardia seriolae]APB00325.1 Bifunctional oligoribonuclease and PAP phosphatase NrnA [Nocardia seriolae]MTJ64994.1 bifunctional oligoribonuclease/PAP phosphatase NrnA [Nocardia seriolae]MTJ71848.1 bifunctional oligoribonuclease/PAP phosphatase NrnA [Nocardia seriolae]MTJ89808.1 bifunctional oligoribonuclease/PAP phosphatase NrnA [Nocardia seriolae]MTK33783.1 bifunctional oligoribonuclease/PAP phosphatase NrnA [Nocardia seriolae]